MGRMGGNQRAYSANPDDYKILEEVGYGAKAVVYRAIYLPFNDVVAVKCLDLDRCNSNLLCFDLVQEWIKTNPEASIRTAEGVNEFRDIAIFQDYHGLAEFREDDIRREVQTMSLIDHPNVISAHCSFVVDRNLWVIMPFMAEGSCLHLMKIAYADGFEEAAIASILKETLKALEYLHRQGHIHRDVKAGNILLDSDGVVKLADFGVTACMFDSGDRQRARNTFVGTPCWIAPEVLQPGSGYNSKADIWSFGITALELAHGHAPFSKYPPMKVLLMTIQNAPPGLDYDRDKKFSKSFKEMVAMCLVKDQTRRPTAEKLLKHPLFKHAKPPELSVKKLFTDLPPLWSRVKAIQLKDDAQLALKKMPSADQEALSQSEYHRGVSAWNFDIEDLKAQASLVQDDDDMSETREEDESVKQFGSHKQAEGRGLVGGNELMQPESLNRKGKYLEGESLETGFPDKTGWKRNGSSAETSTEAKVSTSEKEIMQAKAKMMKGRQTQSGPLMPSAVLCHAAPERGRTSERFEIENQPANEKATREIRKVPSLSGPLMLPNRASANSLSAPIKSSGGFRDSLDDKSKASLVQIKGRFSVTSENLDLVKDIPLSTVPRRASQGSPLRKSASVGDWMNDSKQVPMPKEVCNSNLPSCQPITNSNLTASHLMPHLQNIFQQNSVQQDLILTLLNSLQPADGVDAAQNGKLPLLSLSSESNGSVDGAISERERLLLIKVAELQARLSCLTEELKAEKLKYAQLQQQVKSVSGQENGVEMEVDT